jgi:hypothetical protein
MASSLMVGTVVAEESPQKQKGSQKSGPANRRLTSKEIRATRRGNVSLIPVGIQYVPSAIPLWAIGVRGDFYLDDRIVLGLMVTSATSEFQENFTRINLFEMQGRYHLPNSFYVMLGLGGRYFVRSGLEGSVTTGRFSRTKTFAFDTIQAESSLGLGNHWSWQWVSVGVQWFGVTVPSQGIAIHDRTGKSSQVTDEERAKQKNNFKGDSTEVQWNFVTTSVGVTF